MYEERSSHELNFVLRTGWNLDAETGIIANGGILTRPEWKQYAQSRGQDRGKRRRRWWCVLICV